MMKQQKDLNPTDLTLEDWERIEGRAIDEIKKANEIAIFNGEILVKATQMIMRLGGKTARERMNKELADYEVGGHTP